MNVGAIASSPPRAAPLVAAALAIAHASCKGRWRKDGSPALLHPLAVWQLLVEAGIDDPRTQALALLHDVLEDDPPRAGWWDERIRREVDPSVADQVRLLTDDTTRPALERRAAQLARLPGAPVAVRIVKIADRISNLRSPRPDWSDLQLELYGAHSRALLLVARSTHPLLESWLRAELESPPWVEGHAEAAAPQPSAAEHGADAVAP